MNQVKMTPSNICYIFIHICSCIHITYTHTSTHAWIRPYTAAVWLWSMYTNIHTTSTRPQAHWRVHTETNNIIMPATLLILLTYLHAMLYACTHNAVVEKGLEIGRPFFQKRALKMYIKIGWSKWILVSQMLKLVRKWPMADCYFWHCAYIHT